jgi:hypothetical protein
MARQQRRTKYHVRRRQFLNRDPEYPAFIISVVEDTRGIADDDKDQSWNWGAIELTLGDCYRRVSFDFRMHTARERAASRSKINRIAEAISAVRDAIEIEVASRNKRPRTRRKNAP